MQQDKIVENKQNTMGEQQNFAWRERLVEGFRGTDIDDLNPERGIQESAEEKAKKEKWTLQAKGKPLNKGVAKCILIEKRV